MTAGGPAAGKAPLTRPSGRGLGDWVVLLLVPGIAAAMIVLALARLDPVYRQVPGVYTSWQLLPLALEARYEVGTAWRGFSGTPREQERATTRQETRDLALLQGILGDLSEDVSVRSWQEGSRRTVAVGIAEVDDATATAARLLRPGGALSTGELPRWRVARAWPVGDRFLVALIATAPRVPPAQQADLADTTAKQVESSIGLARVVWWELLSLGPFLLLPVLLGIAYVAWLLLWLAFLVVKLLVFMIVLIPLSLLGLRKAERPTTPLGAEHAGAFRDLAPGVERVDLDRFGIPVAPGAVAWFTALVLALAVAITALTTSLWTASLAWGAVGAALALVWLGRGHQDPWARAARWAVAALVAFDLARALFGLGPGLPTGGALALVAALLLLAGAVTLAWRRTAGPGAVPGYVSWYADVDVRSAAYLLGLTGIALAGGALFLGSNGDLDPASQLASKGLALAGLITLPLVGRRARAARDAARRDWARDREVPEVLLLRSFVDDGLRVPSHRQARHGFEKLIPARRELFEDVVVRAFTRLGPVVAIARPGTGQTELGASRDLIIGSDWLTAVKAEMADAAYIVVILGKGEGLSIELAAMRELELLDRVCLVVPPVEAEDAAERLGKGTEEVDGEGGWGVISTGQAGETEVPIAYEVVALVGAGERRYVLFSQKRDATAYLRVGGFLAGRVVRRSAADDSDEGREA